MREPSQSHVPRFKIGQSVKFRNAHAERGSKKYFSGSGTITAVIQPGIEGYSPNDGRFRYEIDTIYLQNQDSSGWVLQEDLRTNEVVLMVSSESSGVEALHPLDFIGIDTCSAMSVSTEEKDFLFIDKSDDARSSAALNGVGGGKSKVGGRGPLMIKAMDTNGEEVFVVDPAGVYLISSKSQARLRIFGQQRMKFFGFFLQQNKFGDKEDYLVYKDQRMFKMETKRGILMLKARAISSEERNDKQINVKIDVLLRDGKLRIEEFWKKDLDCCFGVNVLNGKAEEDDVSVTSLVVNEAKLTKLELARLDHWRMAHRTSTGERFIEPCQCCEMAKHKSQFKKNARYNGTSISTGKPYWRLYVDGYGGQNSMGDPSYQGAIGGYVFVCPVSGQIKVKLYGTTEQYPAMLYQVLQEIESEGFVCRELYCDTHAVNLSAAAEEVASMFKVKIIPISGGTPQELAYAESAVRTVGQMSRSQMIGAKHLPQFCWGLSDLHAANTHRLIPQKAKGGKSPYQITTGRIPDLDVMFAKIFGCPCQYEPAYEVEHKRSPKTEWGWFVGVQWPMALILRPSDHKVLSISRRKVHCHELIYARFDPSSGCKPEALFEDFVLSDKEIGEAIEKAKNSIAVETKQQIPHVDPMHVEIPDHVLSIKCLSDYKRNAELNTPCLDPVPSSMKESYNQVPQQIDLGENIPEPLKPNKDLLLEEIRKFKDNARQGSITDSIRKALHKVEEELRNTEPGRNALKKRRVEIRGVSPSNVLDEKRLRNDPDWPKTMSVKDEGDLPVFSEYRTSKGIQPLDRVRMLTSRFGKAYAKGRPKYTEGIVRKRVGQMVDVLWDGTTDGMTMRSHKSHMKRIGTALPVFCDLTTPMTQMIWPFKSLETILPVLEVGSCLSESDVNSGGNWPKDFYEALVRPDWRLWVEAVKSENESWNTFDACEEIPYNNIISGASVIPLGELFTIKRNGKYKFRQIALGNMLKEGKDYGETFASTISGDGLRWFCSLAVTCGMPVKGWDATTGYLQTKQRVPVYAYLPSHYGYSDLEYEALAKFRAKLIDVLKSDGIQGIKAFSRKMRNERRIRPDKVLEIKRSVYGIPDAGQAFSMFMQSLHIKKCGMVQSDIDPCIYYKIMENAGDEASNAVTAFLVVISWVDDCRYFGTPELVAEYENLITSNCKCTMEGISKEFVSIQMNHDLDKKTFELTQEEYWEKGVKRFKDFIGERGPKIRLVPLSPADEKLLVEPTAEEIKAAEHLPYPNLLGVVQYPSNYTKLEMKYAMSVLSRHRTKWGVNHFRILIKSLEYGWSTRKMGLKYNGNLTDAEKNLLMSWADSSFTLPRSQGCRLIKMNAAAICFSSKRHTTTDDSTTAAELTELYLAACDVEAMRNLNDELGLKQNGPTVIYQDNQAAIQIAMNRGSLSRRTRATETRTLTVRNKIEDMKVVPIYVKTTEMLADIGTKALEPKLFIYLRNLVCGYTNEADHGDDSE